MAANEDSISAPHFAGYGSIPPVLVVRLTSQSLQDENDPGSRLLRNIMKRLYASGRFQHPSAGALGHALYQVFSQHTPPLHFVLPEEGVGSVTLGRAKTCQILTRIVEGFFRYRDGFASKDGFDALVEQLRLCEINHIDVHEALFGLPYEA